MRYSFYFLFVCLIWGGAGVKTIHAQDQVDPCQQSQSQLRYYFMEYNDDGYLNMKYLEDLFYACDSVHLRSTISYYYLKSASLLEVKDDYVAKPSELFYFYYKKFQDAAYYSQQLAAEDPDFVSTLMLRTDQLAEQVDRAEKLGDKPYLNESRNQGGWDELRRKDPMYNPRDQDINQGKALRRSGDTETSSVPDFAAFPYPVQSYSDVYTSKLAAKPGFNTIGDINQQLISILNAEGYYGKHYFSLPEGFALVTQLERIYPDGNPFPVVDRWRTSVQHQDQFSLRQYLISMVFAEQGYYQSYAFVVLPRSIAENPRLGMGRLNPNAWMTVEGEKLPESIAQLSVANDYVVKVYLFAFDVPGGADSAVLITPPMGVRSGDLIMKHLSKTNLHSKL